LLRSADSAKRARAGLRRLIDDARADAPRSTSVSKRRASKSRAARATK
jgi:hypothetical protein